MCPGKVEFVAGLLLDILGDWFAVRIPTFPLSAHVSLYRSLHSDPELLRALEEAVVSDTSTEHRGDSSTSSSSGDEGSAHQAACDEESSFFSALGSSKNSSYSDGHPNDRAGDFETTFLSDLSSKNSEGRQGHVVGVGKAHEDTGEVHVGDQARRRDTDDEVGETTWMGPGEVLRQMGRPSPILLIASMAAVFLLMVGMGWPPIFGMFFPSVSSG